MPDGCRCSRAGSEAELRYRAETVGAAMLPTYGLCVAGWLYSWLTWDQPHRLFIVALLAVGGVSMVVLDRLPLQHVVRSRWREPFFVAWSLGELDEARSLALIALDVDRFKDVNDRDGHAAGDEALRSVADALRSVVRPDDVCGRLGGDEFMLALPGAGPDAAERVADRLRFALSAGPVTVSAGIAVFPEHATGLDELMRFADNAMYASKRSRAASYAA